MQSDPYRTLFTEVRNRNAFLTLNRNRVVDANPSATSGHSSSSGSCVEAAWWWSALRERAGVDHLCCLCGASSIHRLKGGVRRQMLNNSLKATALALISSPVCAGCHSNWPEHLSNAAYIGLLATRRIYRAHIPIKGRRHVWLMWLWCQLPLYKGGYLLWISAMVQQQKKIEITFSMYTYTFLLIRSSGSEYKNILNFISYTYI